MELTKIHTVKSLTKFIGSYDTLAIFTRYLIVHVFGIHCYGSY